ncbi:hypothetical protein ACA910_008887 [Epithemia clementina (nom. ined.)]
MCIKAIVTLSFILLLANLGAAAVEPPSDHSSKNNEKKDTRKVLATPPSTIDAKKYRSVNSASSPAEEPRRFLAPSRNAAALDGKEERQQKQNNRRSERRRRLKTGDDSGKGSRSSTSTSSINSDDGESPEFVYIQLQDGVYLNTVPREYGVESSSQVGRPLYGSVGCTSAGLCNGPYGAHTLIGEGDARSDPGDDPTLEVIIAGAVQTDAYRPDLSLQQDNAPAIFAFFCPNAEFEVSDAEILECQCTGDAGGACEEADFTFDLFGHLLVSFTGDGCASGFAARLFIECTD